MKFWDKKDYTVKLLNEIEVITKDEEFLIEEDLKYLKEIALEILHVWEDEKWEMNTNEWSIEKIQFKYGEEDYQKNIRIWVEEILDLCKNITDDLKPLKTIEKRTIF